MPRYRPRATEVAPVAVAVADNAHVNVNAHVYAERASRAAIVVTDFWGPVLSVDS
jgi:hypothetical protein